MSWDAGRLPQNKGDTIAYLIPAGQARDEAVAKMIATLIDQAWKSFGSIGNSTLFES